MAKKSMIEREKKRLKLYKKNEFKCDRHAKGETHARLADFRDGSANRLGCTERAGESGPRTDCCPCPP